MSYLIQNFRNDPKNSKLTVRTKSFLVLRNIHVIWTFLFSPLPSVNIGANSYPNIYFIALYGDTFFNKFLKYALPPTRRIKYIFIGLNLPKSSTYTLYKVLDKFLNTEKIDYKLKTFSNNYFINPYLRNISLIVIPQTHRMFIYTLAQLLRLLLHTSIHWPKKLKPRLHYSKLVYNITLLRFLNKYYFKVYNV